MPEVICDVSPLQYLHQVGLPDLLRLRYEVIRLSPVGGKLARQSGGSAFLDRPDSRAKDPEDLPLLLDEYLADQDGRFELIGADPGLGYENTSAFALGLDASQPDRERRGASERRPLRRRDEGGGLSNRRATSTSRAGAGACR